MSMNQDDGCVNKITPEMLAKMAQDFPPTATAFNELGAMNKEIEKKVSPKWPVLTEGEATQVKGVWCKVKYLDCDSNTIMLSVMSKEECKKRGVTYES